jgi:hypothetical protein
MSDESFLHIVVTNDGETVKFFENGVLLRSFLSTDNWTFDMRYDGEKTDDSAS